MVAIYILESQKPLVNSDNLRIASMMKLHRSNIMAEYNRRAAIIEGIRAGRLPAKIIRFFGYPRPTSYDVVARYNTSEETGEGSANPARKTR